MMSIRQQKCSAPRGAVRTHRFSGGEASEPAAQAQQRVVQQRRAERPVVLEARPRAARHEHQLERQRAAVRREQHRLVVDRHDALALADLLLHVVAEQVAAHRAHRVGAEALALAGDRRGHEVQRVELRVRVRQRRAGLLALVDDQVHAGGVRRARACARARPPSRPATWSARRSASEVTGSGALTITSCAPEAAWAVKRSALWVGSGAGASAVSAG